MRAVIVLSLLFPLLLGGIGKSGTGNHRIDEIPLTMKSETGQNIPFNMSDMIESVRYIRVEDTRILGKIGDVKYIGGLFYILDKGNQSIVVVDETGTIISTIAHHGRASYEYLSIWAFDVDSGKGEVHVFDQKGLKIVIYSREGKYLRSVPLDPLYAAFEDMALSGRGTYLLCKETDGKEKGLVELDASGKLVRRLISISAKYRYGVVHNPVCLNRLSDGSVTWMGGTDKNLFYRVFPDGKCVPSYHLSLDVKLPANLQKKTYADPDDMAGQNYYTIFTYNETDHWLLLVAFSQNRAKICYYDKRSKKVHVVTGGADVIDPNGTGLLNYWRGCGNSLIAFLENPDMPAYQRAVREVGEGNNPIIVVATLK